MTAGTLRFLFDEHLSVPGCRALRSHGVEVVHALEVGLGGRSDAELLRWATSENRIVVTRNYQDFAPLVEALASRGETFPGVLFVSSSIRPADVGAHVRALSDWIARHETGANPIANSFAWVT